MNRFATSRGTALEPVRVLCSANAAYAGPLCVMLTSLLINFARDREIEIYVLATNIPEVDRRKIEKSLVQNRPDFDPRNLHWLSPDLSMVEDIHLAGRGAVEVFARLLAPQILPEEFDRVLYLDSDMVILADVSPLYDSLRETCAVHAAWDETVGFVSWRYGVFNYADLGIPAGAKYFNSGVLLMNLRYWREHRVGERVIAYLKQHQGNVHSWDQGGLNAILHDSWVELDPAWNQLHYILIPARWRELGRPTSEWKRTKNHPRIVHFAGEDKPWNKTDLPRYSYFFRYLKKTGYRYAYEGPWLERVIGFRLNFILWRTRVLVFRKRSFGDYLRLLRRLMFPKKPIALV